MKTIANCTPVEFAITLNKITKRVKKYGDGLKKAMKEAAEGETNILVLIDYATGGNLDETMAIAADLCFMPKEKFMNLDPQNGDEDGIAELMKIIAEPRITTFFTSALRLHSLSKML